MTPAQARDRVAAALGGGRAAVAGLDDDLALHLADRLREIDETERSNESYRALLRAVGGAGGSDWYDTKAAIEGAVESRASFLAALREELPRLAGGALGSFRPDVERLRTVRAQVQARAEAAARRPFDRGTRALDLAFSPDGASVATAGGNDASGARGPPIVVFDARSGARVRVAGDPAQAAARVVFSPDGRLLAFAAFLEAPGAFVLDLAAGRPPLLLSDGGGVRDLAFLEAGRRLAVSRHGFDLFHFGVRRGGARKLTLPDRGRAEPTFLAASLDGRRLACTLGDDPDLHVLTFRAKGRSPAHATLALAGARDLGSLALAPDGTRAACTSGGSLRLLDISRRSELARIDGAAACRPAFSADGRLLACADGADVRILDAATGAERSRVPAGGDVAAVALSPDGARLALAGAETSVVTVVDLPAS